MKGLSPEALEMLKRLGIIYAAQPFAVEKAETLRPPALCRIELQMALRELREAGLLELRQNIWGEKFYQIPGWAIPMIQQGFFTICSQVVANGAAALELEAGQGLPGELFRMLVFIAREGLPLSGKGVIHKKTISRLAAQLSLGEVHFQGLFSQIKHTDPYPLPVRIMLDLLLCLGLLSRQNSGYLLEMEVLEGWLGLSEPEMNDIVYEVVFNRYGSAEPAAQHFRYLIASPEYSPGEWFGLTDVMEGMVQSHLVAEEAVAELEASALAWLSFMAGFGWCELGYTVKGESCFRWTAAKPRLTDGDPADIRLRQPADPNKYLGIKAEPLSSSNAMFIVQPDFEVLVPPEVSYAVRWTLAGCAELLHSDDLWSFRLTRGMLESAAEHALSPDDVISWLKSHSLGGLPDQVELSLAQWRKGIGRTVLSEVILLTCQTETDAADVAAHPRLLQDLTRIGPLHFTVQPESLEKLRKELAVSGMAPPRMIGGRQGEAERQWPLALHERVSASARYTAPAAETEKGLVGSGAMLQLIPLTPLDTQEEVLPFVDSVPQMWIKEWRRYHGTTAQKIMEQALAWGCRVQLSLKEEVHEFIPAQISRNPWKVAGCLLNTGTNFHEEVRLAAEEWNEMKLVIPHSRRNSSSA